MLLRMTSLCDVEVQPVFSVQNLKSLQCSLALLYLTKSAGYEGEGAAFWAEYVTAEIRLQLVSDTMTVCLLGKKKATATTKKPTRD